jgi:hypothetical protein
MGKDDEPKEIPADKLAENLPPAKEPNVFSKLKGFKNELAEKKARVEEARDRNEELAARKRWNKFRKTPLGKAWVQFKKRMKKTKNGRKVLAGLTLGFYGIILVGMLFAVPITGNLLDKLFSPNQIELSQELKDQGFYQSCSGRKHCSPDGVAYKILDEQEQRASSVCDDRDEWCVRLIPLDIGCVELRVNVSYFEKEADWIAAASESFAMNPKVGKDFKISSVYDLPINSTQGDFPLISVDDAICNH